jgi:hypothetical protein
MQHFKETFNQFVKKLMKNKKMAKEEAMLAALVSYAFGSAVTDGAILGLLEELCGLGVASEDEEMAPVDADVSIDQTSTTWCAPHRWSLTCKVALHRLKLTGQEVQHRSIKPPKRWFAIVMNDMYDVCRDLVNYFDDEENYRMLKEFAKANPITDAATGAILMVRKMYNPSPTRLNAYADLFLAIHHNKKYFEKLADAPPAVTALLTDRTLDVVDGPVSTPVTYNPGHELDKLTPILLNLVWISKIAEANDTDACIFQWRLSRFVRDISQDGRTLSWFDEAERKHEVPVADCNRHSKLVGNVLRNLRVAIGFYFDSQLEQDWATLLCILLHPTSSGCPAAAIGTDRFRPWPCFKGRFESVFRKAHGEWVQRDADSMLHAIMRSGEKVLKEELELQYDMENCSISSMDLLEEAAAPAAAASASAVQPAPKKPHILDGLYSDDEDDDAEPEADNPVAAPLSKKEVIVKEALDYWLVDREPSKPQANGQTALSMVAFWSKEDASARKGAVGLLKRVAARAGALMISQCATERINKIPKEVWTADRRSILPETMARDVFIFGNKDKYPSCDFEWPVLK